jgi:hypothetical protein
MSSKSRSVVSILPSKPVASEEVSDWRSLGGVAFAILADLDRRRPKLVASPEREPQPKAA